MTSLWEPLAVILVIAVLMSFMVPLLRGHPITSWRQLRRLGGEPETTTRFHTYGFLLLALLALGDARDVYQPLGSPWLVGACIGALVGLSGERARGWLFKPLGVLAVSSNLWQLFSGDLAHQALAAAVLLPLVIGIALGVPASLFNESRVGVLLAKACAAVTFTNFAVAPLDVPVIGEVTDPARVAATVGIAVLAAVLFVLPGAGVSFLIGIGTGLLGFYYGLRVPGPAMDFTVAFLLALGAAGAVHSRIGSRRARW